ncbi:MAG: DUF805 domain-containing protein [Pseudomonadota bacterium]
MQWYLSVMKQYANFNGRARRKEYWMFFLIYILIIVVATIIDSVAELPGVVSGIVALVHIIPSLSAGVRRMHDTGRSGWAILIFLVPIAGPFLAIYWLAQDSKPGDNTYGVNPKAVAA